MNEPHMRRRASKCVDRGRSEGCVDLWLIFVYTNPRGFGAEQLCHSTEWEKLFHNPVAVHACPVSH